MGGVTALHTLMQFVPAKDLNVLITHLKVSVMMPIDQKPPEKKCLSQGMTRGKEGMLHL